MFDSLTAERFDRKIDVVSAYDMSDLLKTECLTSLARSFVNILVRDCVLLFI